MTLARDSRYRLLEVNPAGAGQERNGGKRLAAASADLPNISTDPDLARSTLLADFDVDVTCGNRALRYVVGFGVGKGSIHSTLTMTDAATGAVKFRSTKDDVMEGGLFGGDMHATVRANIDGLVANYPKR